MEFRKFVHIGHFHGGIELHFEGLVKAALFGGNQNNTVGTAGSVESCSGTAFEDGDVCDVVGVDVNGPVGQRNASTKVFGVQLGVVDGYSVHHKQGLVVIGCERGVAANFDVGSRTGRTAGLGDLHPGSFGGHCRNEVGFPRFFEVATADTFDGITDGAFFAINAQGRDHNLAQLGGIAFHKNFHDAALGGHLGGFHTEVGQA